MGLSQANIKWISTLSGVSELDISGALSKEEEVTLDLKLAGRVITQTDEAALKTTLTDAGIEIGYKKLAKESGVTLESGEKDAKVIADKLKVGITSILEEKYKGQTPTDELLASQQKVKDSEKAYETLLTTHQTTLGLVEEKDKLYSGLQTEIKTKDRNNSILKAFPDKMKQDKGDALIIAINTFQFEEVDGVTVTKRDGQVVTDGLGKPEKVDNVIKSFVEEKEWVKGVGMGGNDRVPGGLGKKGLTPEEAEKAIIESGKDPGSQEGLKMYNELTSKA